MTDNNVNLCTLCSKRCSKEALQCQKGKRFFASQENRAVNLRKHEGHEGSEDNLMQLVIHCDHILKHQARKKKGGRVGMVKGHRHEHEHDYEHVDKQYDCRTQNDGNNHGHNHGHDHHHKYRQESICNHEYKYQHKRKHEHRHHELYKDNLFSMLSEDEKENLQHILTKVSRHWSDGPYNTERLRGRS